MSWQYSLDDFKRGSVAWIIQRYIQETNTPGMKPLGPSHLYTLRLLQRSPIGEKRAATLKKSDVIDHCRMRRATVCAATVNQDVTFLSGALKYAGSAWEDCEDVSVAAIEAARPTLVKHGQIGKSTPRTRVPTGEELDRLMAYFAEKEKSGRQEIRMTALILFALESTRRISEICRIKHGDIDWARKDADGNLTPMYMVRDLKHPTKKRGNDKWFPVTQNLAEIILSQPRVSNETAERVFPFVAKSAGAAYTIAKKELGIANLRFHDNRREGITRWIARLDKNLRKVRMISGHENSTVLERVYDATDPVTLHADLAKLAPRVAA
jgi:integrase